MKHRRANHHRRFRRCDCVRCSVAYFSDWQQAVRKILDGDKVITITPAMKANPESVERIGEMFAHVKAVA